MQRQAYLMSTGLSESAAYDVARKELYRVRHFRETELRVAREEALATGAFFGMGPNEVGMMLEDQQFEDWKKWAAGQIDIAKAAESRAYTGSKAEDAAAEESVGSSEAHGQDPSETEVREGQEGKAGKGRSTRS